jgi:hypothetical protein
MNDASAASSPPDDRGALLYVVQLLVGVAVNLAVLSAVSEPLLGELLGFLAMCAAQCPLARRTWAAGISARRYASGVLLAAAVAVGVRLVLMP